MLREIGLAIAKERQRRKIDAKWLGLPTSIVRKIEAGEHPLTVLELESIAMALQVDLQALREGRIVPQPKAAVFLLHHPLQDFDSRDASLLDEALEHARARNRLATLLGDKLGAQPEGRIRPQATRSSARLQPARHGYQLAQTLRTLLDNPVSPFGDLREITERDLGVTILVRRLRTHNAVAVCIKDASSSCIVLAPTKNEALARVRIAHEICHALFDPAVDGLHLVIDQDEDRSRQHSEQRARAFAAELLLPLAGLRAQFGSERQVQSMPQAQGLVQKARTVFGTTWRIAANHLCNQGFIDTSLREQLEHEEPDGNTPAPPMSLPDPGGPSIEVATLSKRAHRGGLITDGEARSLLGLNYRQSLPWEVD